MSEMSATELRDLRKRRLALYEGMRDAEGEAEPIPDGMPPLPKADDEEDEEMPDEKAPSAEGDDEGGDEEEEAGVGGEEDTTDEEEDEEEAADEDEKDKAITPVMDVDKVTSVAAESQVTMILFTAEAENPFYVMLIDGTPVARVALQDQENAAGLKDTFVSPQYADSVATAVKNSPLKEVLDSIKAKTYVAMVETLDVVTKKVAEERKKIEEEAKTRTEGFVTALLETSGIVIEAGLKNFIVHNPVKAALVERIHASGVDEMAAVKIVEDSWRAAGKETLASIFETSQKWMSYTPEAMAEIVEAVGISPYRDPMDAAGSHVTAAEERAEATDHRHVPASVPLRTVTGAPPQAGVATPQLPANVAAYARTPQLPVSGGYKDRLARTRESFGLPAQRTLTKRGV